jgi:hypothetical protein
MITRAEVEKLGARHAVEPTVLSLYLTVPPHPAPLSLLTARADELIAAAEGAVGRPAGKQDRNAVREKLATSCRDWPGRTVAVFACADVGLLEAFPLPGLVRERAVLGIRPHIRPLLNECGALPERVSRAPHSLVPPRAPGLGTGTACAHDGGRARRGTATITSR